MRLRIPSLISVLFSCTLASSALAKTRLMLVGGGDLPKAALARFCEWAPAGHPPRILVIPWATTLPDETMTSVRQDFAAACTADLVEAPLPPLDDAARATFLGQLDQADAVFFPGGDQNRVMATIGDQAAGQALLQRLRARFAAGVPFGGTSAGTEVMARRMITGAGDFTVLDGAAVTTAPGIGLVPAGMLVDMHFVRRQRENRLFGLLLAGPETLGLGIDQDTAAALEDGSRLQVYGKGTVMVIRAQPEAATLAVKVLYDGQSLALEP